MPVSARSSNEVSGRAIMARDRQSDVGSFVYQDNWGRAIRHTATILNDLIPHVYDVERTIRILGDDGKEELIDINKAVAGDGMEETERVLNDVTVGAYDVVFRPGPSFSTRREEAREGMNGLPAILAECRAARARPDRGIAGLAERRQDRQADGASVARADPRSARRPNAASRCRRRRSIPRRLCRCRRPR